MTIHKEMQEVVAEATSILEQIEELREKENKLRIKFSELKPRAPSLYSITLYSHYGLEEGIIKTSLSLNDCLIHANEQEGWEVREERDNIHSIYPSAELEALYEEDADYLVGRIFRIRPSIGYSQRYMRAVQRLTEESKESIND